MGIDIKLLWAVKQSGYTLRKRTFSDFGMTEKWVIEKDGQKSVLPVKECYYDTDENGNMTQFHGILDIQTSPWYKSL